MKIMKEEEKREREDELAQLEGTVVKLKLESEKERIKAQELEALLKKHKHRLEKQRKLAESQTSYRLCLERVLRDTMHQYAFALLIISFLIPLNLFHPSSAGCSCYLPWQ